MAALWFLVLVCLRLDILASADPNQSPTPSCEVLAPTREPCRWFRNTDYCCYARHLSRAVPNVTSAYVRGGAFSSTNVSFYINASDETGFFLLGRAGSSPVDSECYLIETRTEGELQVLVANLSTSANYKVNYGDYLRNFHTWLQDACVGEKELFLNSSVLDIIFKESDAYIQLYRPPNLSLVPPELSSLHFTLYSSATNFTCQKDGNCTIDAVIRKSFCLDNPYDNILEIKNASQYYNGTHRLRYHCAVVELAGCCLKTNPYTILAALPLPLPEPPPPDTQYATSMYVGLAILGVLLALLVAFSRHMLVLYRKSSTPTRSDSLASPDHPELQELLRPVVLLYCWENNVHLQRVVGILIEIMHDSGLEVTDPYADSSLLDNVHRAAENVLRDNNHWLVVTTRRSREICRNARDNIQLENAYEQFHATVFELMRTNPGQMRGKQIFTLIIQQNVDIPLSLTRTCNDDLAEDLVRGIPGVVESDNWTTLFARLRRHIAKYNEDDLKTPDLTLVPAN
ncbi:uncharacterized protein LOC113216971 [Frankliniella occidentalis]|uniref:Uncharacterized protein LOC113216971 n=1 Tax=Frankliniella occidentalis TaxID=133901 RepID=A0A9C6XC63_FRAOC|nr:uncharacterized protein LOC113216971 [Frankliniella occidentalis]